MLYTCHELHCRGDISGGWVCVFAVYVVSLYKSKFQWITFPLETICRRGSGKRENKIKNKYLVHLLYENDMPGNKYYNDIHSIYIIYYIEWHRGVISDSILALKDLRAHRRRARTFITRARDAFKILARTESTGGRRKTCTNVYCI